MEDCDYGTRSYIAEPYSCLQVWVQWGGAGGDNIFRFLPRFLSPPNFARDSVSFVNTLLRLVTRRFKYYIRRFKDRLYEHRTDMSKTGNRTNSSLASHIWDLKDRGLNYDVKWKIKARGTKFNPSTKKCRICLKEKHFILYKTEGATLNSRREIFNTCMHRWTSLLSKLKKSWKTWVFTFTFIFVFGIEETFQPL